MSSSNNTSYNLRVRNDFRKDDFQIPIMPSTSSNTSYNLRRVRNNLKKDDSNKSSVVTRKKKLPIATSSTSEPTDDSLDLQINQHPKKNDHINRIKKYKKSSQHNSTQKCNVNCNTKKRNNDLEIEKNLSEELNQLLPNTVSHQRTKNKQKLQPKVNSTNSILEQTCGYIDAEVSKQGVAELFPFVKLNNMKTEQEIVRSKKVNDKYNEKQGHNFDRPDKNEQLFSASSASNFVKQNCVDAEISKRNLLSVNEENVEIDQKLQKAGNFPSSPTVEHICHENMENGSNKNDHCERTNEIRTIFKHFCILFGNLLTPQTTLNEINTVCKHSYRMFSNLLTPPRKTPSYEDLLEICDILQKYGE